jgi:hypothetical protein
MNSPALTIGGGKVVDSLPEKHRSRTSAATLERLSALAQADDIERIAILVEISGDRGLTHADLSARSGAPDETIDLAIDRLSASGRIRRVEESANSRHLASCFRCADPLLNRPGRHLSQKASPRSGNGS